MKVDPKNYPVFFPTEGPRNEPSGGEVGKAETGIGSPAGTAAESEFPSISIDPLQQRLTEQIRNKDLSDPDVKLEVGLLVMRETLLSVFDESFLQGLDMETMLGSFRDFVENDPSLQVMFDQVLNELVNSPS